MKILQALMFEPLSFKWFALKFVLESHLRSLEAWEFLGAIPKFSGFLYPGRSSAYINFSESQGIWLWSNVELRRSAAGI